CGSDRPRRFRRHHVFATGRHDRYAFIVALKPAPRLARTARCACLVAVAAGSSRLLPKATIVPIAFMLLTLRHPLALSALLAQRSGRPGSPVLEPDVALVEGREDLTAVACRPDARHGRTRRVHKRHARRAQGSYRSVHTARDALEHIVEDLRAPKLFMRTNDSYAS